MCIARPIVGYRGLVETCRERANELAISRLEIDRLAGLPEGYSSKLLGRNDSEKCKRMWPVSLEAILGTLGLQIIIVEDHAATSRTLSRRIPVDHSNQRFDNKCNSPKQLPKIAAPQIEQQPGPKKIGSDGEPNSRPPRPPSASRAHLRVIQGKKKGRVYGSRKF
jgi:hypothetical protein